MKPGVYDMNPEEYAAIPAVNWSSLKDLAVSAKLLRYRTEHPRPDTDTLRFGRALHAAVLEPERWGKDWVSIPDFGDGRTKAAKEAKAAWLAEQASGAEMLSADDFVLCQDLAAAVRAHEGAASLLRGGKSEQAVVWVDEATGLTCKARLDYLRPTDFGEIKTTRKDTLRGFQRDASALLYHGQIAFYLTGALACGALCHPCDPPWIIAVRTVEPYDVTADRITAGFLSAGQTLVRSLLDRYAACQAADWWPGLQEGIGTLDIEPWAANWIGGESDE